MGGSLDVNKRLPADPSNYKFIDVSREPIDDNPNHSGASLMRVPVPDLLVAEVEASGAPAASVEVF